MAGKPEIPQRDSALIKVLERLSDQLQKQDLLLEDIVKHQLKLTKSVESADYNWKMRQIDANEASRMLRESVGRYRSDMLSLVNEQDHINKNIANLSDLVNKTAYALEKAVQILAGLEERVKTQEKTINDHFSHSLKQEKTLPERIADSTRSITKMHMDTEKSLGKMHQETQRQLEKLHQETTRRLLVLGDMEAELQTLLIRTEPPEKKPLWFVRLIRKACKFCRTRLLRRFRR